MTGKLLRIFFPESCPICKNPSTEHEIAPICQACWNEISPYNGPLCKICGKPLVSEVSIICGECISDKPAFKYARSFGLYEGTLKEAINLWKYHGIKRLSRPLAQMLLRMKILDINPAPPWWEVDVILPVPLHKRKLRQREFNQSALLARHLGRRLGISVIYNCLIKLRDALPQVELSGEDRRKNVRGAFGVRNKGLIQEKNLLLVDDVFTTGATVRECCRVLKKVGAGDIYVITLTTAF